MEDGHQANLFEALLCLRNAEEFSRFFADLCTPKEIHALQERWKVCTLLEADDLSYRDIHKLTGASLTTIGRVARFLRNERYQGYRLVLQRIKAKEKYP